MENEHGRRDAGLVNHVALLVLYQLVRVNYGEIPTHEEAELFGATVLGKDVDDYYETLCGLADELSSAGPD